MKKYLIDTNIILRFLLTDNKKLYKKSTEIIYQAKNKKIELEIIPEVIFELDYVLRGVYKLEKEKVIEVLLNLVKTPYFFIEKRELIIKVLDEYREISIDLFDVYLFYLARSENKEVISFDKDFKKLK
ncbi:MAG: hypothetical protein Fur009_1610 [Candidatus Microgenomates bacterium]